MSNDFIKNSDFDTKSVHIGTEPDITTKARALPLYLSNGFAFENIQHGADIFAMKTKGFAYSRGSNPNLRALENRLTALEGGTASVAMGSGQGALLTLIMVLCRTGDDYVVSNQLFGGSLTLLHRLDSQLDIKGHFIDPFDLDALENAITPKTKAIITETIINPTGHVVDLPAIAQIAKRHNIPLIVDNTLATPALLRPIEHGANIVFHSASKFMNGHGQVIGGAIIDTGNFNWNDERFPLLKNNWPEYNNTNLLEAFPGTELSVACRLVGLRELGPSLSPANAWFIMQGLETLSLRMSKHSQNALKIAAFLSDHEKIETVSYPALASHPNHKLAKSLCPDGMGSIFTATLKGGLEAATHFTDRLKLVSHLVNVGETRSLVCHPLTTTHSTLNQTELDAAGIKEGTLRFSIGIEDADDILADISQALA